jgi:hypothetical protein
MAKSWCGFVPQNQNIKEQWNLLEASQGEIIEKLQGLLEGRPAEETAASEEEDLFSPSLPKQR